MRLSWRMALVIGLEHDRIQAALTTRLMWCGVGVVVTRSGWVRRGRHGLRPCREGGFVEVLGE